MPEPEYNYLDDIRRVYRSIIAAGPADGLTLAEVREEALIILRPMVESGEVKLPEDDLIRAAIGQVDKADGDRGDSALRRIVAGQDALDMGDLDPWLEVAARIGGRRKPWGAVTRDDLLELDQQRFQNAQAAQKAYAEWRQSFSPTLTALLDHATVADAVAAGAFDTP